MSEGTNYKSFSDEEDRIYRKHIEVIRANVSSGIKFDVACEFIRIEDKELRGIIIDNALKIEIAELHFGKGMSLDNVSKKLGISMERLLNANREMMEDVIHNAGKPERSHIGGSGTTIH